MNYHAGQTLRVVGSGGSEQVLDVPADGSHRRLQFDSLVETGGYVILGEAEDGAATEAGDPQNPPAIPAQVDDDGTEESPTDVPDGSIAEVVAWVHSGAIDGDTDADPAEGWLERAEAAQSVEALREAPRKGITELLTKVLSEPEAGEPGA